MELLRITRPETKFVALRHHGAYNKIGGTIDKLFGLAMPLGVQMTGALTAVYHDNPAETPEDQLRSDAAIPVTADYDLSGTDLTSFTMPGGEFLAVDHIGPYSGLGDTWGKFMDEIEANHGAEMDWNWTFEEYLNDCEEVGMENAHTRICCRLK